MKQVRITGPRHVELVDVPDPKAAGDFVVVKNHAVPMCTEYKAYRGDWTAENLGHEARLMVVDWTLYEGIYPFVGEATLPGE